jgi:spore coat protein U-like protein
LPHVPIDLLDLRRRLANCSYFETNYLFSGECMRTLACSTTLLALCLASLPAGAGNVNSTMAVGGAVVSACEVTGVTQLNFSALPALASGTAATGDTGSTLLVACSSDLTPMLYVVGLRSLSDGAGTPHLIPFNLSLTSGAAVNDLPAVTGTDLAMTKDGTPQTVTIYGKVLVADAQGKPTGNYTANLTVNVDY